MLRGGKALVDYGPVFMTVSAFGEGIPLNEAAMAGACRAVELLEELVPFLAVARLPIGQIRLETHYPIVLQRMIGAVEQLQESDFTPMAAVAGTFSDLVKDTVKQAGATKIVVNNGGDIALEAGISDVIRVGIIRDITSGLCEHVLEVTVDDGIGGVATSGLGGRSLTKGIASAAAAFAENCALADAAATSIGNATNCEDKEILRCFAEELDHQTDLRGQLVTKSRGELSLQSKKQAVANGLLRAKELYRSGMIKGAVIYVEEVMAAYPEGIIRRRV